MDKIVYLVVILLLSSISVSAQDARAEERARETDVTRATLLEKGKPIERELADSDSHTYLLPLASDQYLHIVVEQLGVDVQLRVYDPNNHFLSDINAGTGGVESFVMISDLIGDYKLVVKKAKQKDPAGKYTVRIEQLRPATKADSVRLDAQGALANGDFLFAQTGASQFRLALQTYEQALQLYRELGDEKGEMASLRGLGNACYALNKNDEALEHYQQAFKIAARLNDQTVMAMLLTGIANIYTLKDEAGAALTHFELALPIYVALKDSYGQAYTINGMAALLFTLGDNLRAIEAYRRAIEIYRDSKNAVGEASSLYSLAHVYFTLDQLQDAFNSYQQALTLFKNAGDRKGEIAALSGLGFVSAAIGNRSVALDFYNQALTLQRQAGDRAGAAGTLLGIGGVYYSAKEYQKAIEEEQQAFAIFRMNGDRFNEAIALSNIGLAYSGANEHEKAITNFTPALAAFRDMAYTSGEIAMRFGIARAHRDLGRLMEARAQLEEALKLTDSALVRITDPHLRLFNLGSLRELYQLYIDLLMSLHKSKPTEGYDRLAWQAGERARARYLLEAVGDVRAATSKDIEPSLAEREKSLRQRINSKARTRLRILSGPDARINAERLTILAQELNALVADYEKLTAEIERCCPRYTSLWQPAPPTVKQVQEQLLDKESGLLEYALGSERSYVWLITAQTFTSYELAPRADINTAVRNLYNLTVARDKPAAEIANSAEYQQALTTLSELVIKPVVSKLDKTRLLIVADGALQYLPFSALPRGQTVDSAGQAKTTLMIDDHEITLVPSVGALLAYRRERGSRSAAALNIATLSDPIYGRDDERVKKGAGSGDSIALIDTGAQSLNAAERAARDIGEKGAQTARRPASRNEVRELLNAATSLNLKKEYNDFAVNRALLESGELRAYNVIHFATVGYINSLHPTISGLMLSMVDEQGELQNGFLRTTQVFNLNLPADLIVLSGTMAGTISEQPGEALAGLARGFMHAGSARLAATLWDSGDEARTALITRFYQELAGAKPKPPAAALRAAQLSMRAQTQWRSPYYWAVFQLHGESR